MDLLLIRALIDGVEGEGDVLGEPGCKDILVGTKLVPGLPHNGVDHIEARDLVLWPALVVERQINKLVPQNCLY